MSGKLLGEQLERDIRRTIAKVDRLDESGTREEADDQQAPDDIVVKVPEAGIPGWTQNEDGTITLGSAECELYSQELDTADDTRVILRPIRTSSEPELQRVYNFQSSPAAAGLQVAPRFRFGPHYINPPTTGLPAITVERTGDEPYPGFSRHIFPISYLDYTLADADPGYTRNIRADGLDLDPVACPLGWLPPLSDVTVVPHGAILLIYPAFHAIHGKIVATVDAACWQPTPASSDPYNDPDPPACLTPGSSELAFHVYRPDGNGNLCPQYYNNQQPVYLPLVNIVGEIDEGSTALATLSDAGWVATVASCAEIGECDVF